MILGTIYMYFINPTTGYLKKKKRKREYCTCYMHQFSTYRKVHSLCVYFHFKILNYLYFKIYSPIFKQFYNVFFLLFLKPSFKQYNEHAFYFNLSPKRVHVIFTSCFISSVPLFLSQYEPHTKYQFRDNYRYIILHIQIQWTTT